MDKLNGLTEKINLKMNTRDQQIKQMLTNFTCVDSNTLSTCPKQFHLPDKFYKNLSESE